MMGDREVRISLIAATTKSTHPTERRAIVSADDPAIEVRGQNEILLRKIQRTVGFAAVKTQEDTKSASHQKGQS
jgi:hypothetical protein